jgi:hypothetical protein
MDVHECMVHRVPKKKLWDSQVKLLCCQGVVSALPERRLGYHSRAGIEPGTSEFSTLRINHYAARGDITISTEREMYDLFLPLYGPSMPERGGHRGIP